MPLASSRLMPELTPEMGPNLRCHSQDAPGFSVSVDRTTEPEWNELLPRFADASIYQTWAYGAVSWERKHLSHLVLRKGEEVVGMAQLRILRVPLVSRGMAYLRWGPLHRLREASPDGRTLGALLAAIRDEYVRRRKLLVSLLPAVFQEEAEGRSFRERVVEAGFKQNLAFVPHRTIRLDLAPPLEALRKALEPRWRIHLNRAEKNTLSVVEGVGEDLYRVFLTTYREMLARKQYQVGVSADEFARMQTLLPSQLKMRVLLCQKDGLTLNGLVVGAVGDTAVYLLGATSDAGTKANGAYLLQWRAIQWLRENGVRWYDLGGINPERNPGGYQFKKGFGGQEFTRLGEYRLSTSTISSAAVSCGDCLRAVYRRLRARLRAS